MDHVVKKVKWVKPDEQVILDRKVTSAAKVKKVQLEKRVLAEKEDRPGLMVFLVGLALMTGKFIMNQGFTNLIEPFETVNSHSDSRSDNQQTLNFDFGLFLFDK